ncbi:YkvA family protein [Bradyrhizobium sp.]|uniref:YkvA family protein n=1 Tax=Bradyrhizobium sp. TaxID=376 RepID=UPI002E02CA02|nr:YkvA family protein [Bradyrhizobium sp.]
MSRAKTWARALRRDAHAIALAARDPRVPWTVKLLAIAVAGYALSPIDLIPDFIPVLGYLDDLVIVPLGIWLVIALIPEDVMREYRAMASAAVQRPVSKAAAIIIVALWISGVALLGWAALVYWDV